MQINEIILFTHYLVDYIFYVIIFTDLKVILDIVPNHSSIEHLWFNLSRAEVDPYDDFYIWANGTVNEFGEKVEPNHWVGFRKYRITNIVH